MTNETKVKSGAKVTSANDSRRGRLDAAAAEGWPLKDHVAETQQQAATRLGFDPIDEAHRQWTAHGWEGADEVVAATSIIRAQQIVVSRMQEVLRPRGFSFPRFELLVVLYCSRRGAMPLGKVGERLMAHPTSVTNLVDRLEADHLVIRMQNPRDRRAVLASITAQGRAVVEEIAPQLGAIKFGLADLGSEGSRELTAALTPLRLAAGDFVVG